MQTALGRLPCVAGVGTVAVTQITASDCVFVFSNGLTGTPLSVKAHNPSPARLIRGPRFVLPARTSYSQSSSAVVGVTQLNLSFNGVTNSTVTSSGMLLDPTTIRNTLNGLSSIAGAGGSVTVTQTAVGAYKIVFSGTWPAPTWWSVPTCLPGTASWYDVLAGSSVVDNGSVIPLQTSLNLEPVLPVRRRFAKQQRPLLR